MRVTLGVLAHVDAGKTTLSERLLFACGALRALGRVDHRDACLDFDPTERARGITIYSAQAEFFCGEKTYYLVDTPGHADFLPEMERCLSVLDYAILVVSATDGVQAGTITLWHMLARRGLPVIVFLNKADCDGAMGLDCLQALPGEFCDLTGGLDAAATEQIAMTDEGTLDALLAGTLSQAACADAALAGRCPVATMLPYSCDFPAMTRGRGVLSLEFDGYEPCPDPEPVILELGYDPERDVENPADSVFCAHGAGYHVKWSDAPAQMHLRLD